MRLLRKLRTAFSFSPKQWRLFLSAYGLLLRARFLVRFFSAQAVEKALAGNGSVAHQEPNEAVSAPRAALLSRQNNNITSKTELLDLFRLAWRYQWKRPKCLATSLAKQLFLERYGIPTNLRIGVHKQDNKLLGHAWCEDSLPPVQSSQQVENPFVVLEPLGSEVKAKN